MTRIMQQKQKRLIPTSCLCQRPKLHQNSEHNQNLKHHRFPSDPAFECAFNIFLLTLLGWEQNMTLIMSLSSRFKDLLAMRNTGHYMGTGPRRAVGNPVIARVLLCRSMVCPCVQESGEVSEGYPVVAEAKSVITTQVKIEKLT